MEISLDEKALRRIKQNHHAWKRYLRTKDMKDGEDYLAYIKARKVARRYDRRAVTNYDYEKDLASKCKKSPRSFWKYVNTKSKPKVKIPDLHYQGSTWESNKDKAETLNNFFASTFTNESADNLEDLKQESESNIHDIGDLIINRDMVKKKLLALDTTKSNGPDEPHPKLLKELAEEISTPLATINNQ
jgi:hypothetical protein